MSHNLDFSLGRAAIAFKANNGKPWHGMGAHILDSDGPNEIAEKAGLDYRVLSSPATYTVPNKLFDASKPIAADNLEYVTRSYENRAVLYRDDTQEALSVMSDSHYTPAQPIQLLEGLFELTKESGYEMDVAGALKGGRVVWALAKRKDGEGAIGKDIIQPYVLLLTSYDGTYARTARLTSVRVVCQNTVSLSGMIDAKTTSKQRNSAEFDLSKSNSLIGDLAKHDKAFEEYLDLSKRMAKQRMSPDTLKRFFAKFYAPTAFVGATKWLDSPISFDKDKVTSNATNNVATLHDIFRDSPGSELPSANGTLWGALNAVTFMQDHMARTKEGKRWESTTIGNGNRMKDEALSLAISMLA